MHNPQSDSQLSIPRGQQEGFTFQGSARSWAET
jgi:hypothetical protein